jgi:NADPH:quinone reductase-like Zn-dependent oxidoreductase
MMASRIPESTRALVIKKCSAEAKPVYHDAVLETRPLQQLKPGEVLVKMGAVSFNHRDVSNVTGGGIVCGKNSLLTQSP